MGKVGGSPQYAGNAAFPLVQLVRHAVVPLWSRNGGYLSHRSTGNITGQLSSRTYGVLMEPIPGLGGQKWSPRSRHEVAWDDPILSPLAQDVLRYPQPEVATPFFHPSIFEQDPTMDRKTRWQEHFPAPLGAAPRPQATSFLCPACPRKEVHL